MEAHGDRLAMLRLVMAFLFVLALTAASGQAAQHQTANFVVEAATQQIAEQVGEAAERFRNDLAIHWLGQPLPKNWSRPCPITVKVGPNLGAGGATSFMFNRGEVYGWRMNIQGTLERVLDSVLPHEVTHTIFASHFRQPLPRWADEGACTTVEHVSERTNHQKYLQVFLRTGRGISFNRMFEMKDYPQDVMPLYAQGHSVVTFLLQDGGQSKFMQFVQDGLKSEQWADTTRKFYGYPSLAAMQDAWLNWLKQGSVESPQTTPAQLPENTLASNDRQLRPEPNLIYRGQNEDPRESSAANAAIRTVRPGPADEPVPPTKGFAPLARIRGALDKALQRGEWQPIPEQAARPAVGRVEEPPASSALPTVANNVVPPPQTAASNLQADNRLAESSATPSRSGKVLLEWRRKSPAAIPLAEAEDSPAVSRRSQPIDASEPGRTLRR